MFLRLLGCGITYAEAGSFVSPKWVPQMANTDQVFEQLNRMNYPSSITLCGLTPNLKGLEGALAANVKEVAVFAAASEAFSKKNINSTIEEALNNQKQVTEQALASGSVLS
jgi:hydroxymethylglutaryl-CoA lyase